MLSLTEPLKTGFEYGDKVYPIDLYFDTVLRFYDLLDDKRLDEVEKITTAFEMFFGLEPKDPNFVIAAFEQITKYISTKPYGNDDDLQEDNSPVINSQRTYSFKQDAEAIYAGFLEQYGIDLVQEQGHLHWDKFKALFQGLGPNTYFQRVVEIRTKDTKDLSGEALNRLLEAKQFYELDVNKTQEAKEQQIAAFGESLLNWAKS